MERHRPRGRAARAELPAPGPARGRLRGPHVQLDRDHRAGAGVRRGRGRRSPRPRTVTVRTRTCGLRVYLRRPWFSSGDGELLGVVLRKQPWLSWALDERVGMAVTDVVRQRGRHRRPAALRPRAGRPKGAATGAAERPAAAGLRRQGQRRRRSADGPARLTHGRRDSGGIGAELGTLFEQLATTGLGGVPDPVGRRPGVRLGRAQRRAVHPPVRPARRRRRRRCSSPSSRPPR